MPRFHFRVRFRLPEDSALGSEERTLRIASPSGRWTYILEAVGGQTLKDSQWFLIKDDGGFDTYDDALKAGRRVKNAVMWWGAKTRVGADCGNDSTNAWVTQYCIDQVRKEQGIRLLNELHGLQVYEEDPELPTQFVASSVQPKVLKGIYILSPALSNSLFPWVLLPCFLGELSLALWLVVKGVKVEAAQATSVSTKEHLPA